MSDFNQVIASLEGKRKQLQDEMSKLDAALAALRGVYGNARKGSSGAAPKRVMSVAARRRIAAAQRARWARYKAQKKAA